MGDVLIGSLGEETHPVGRACLYPMDLPAINKADCFRLRCKPELMRSSFAMYSMNAEYVKNQIRQIAQGVTRVRLNGQNLKRVCLKIPSSEEQQKFSQRLDSINNAIDQEMTRVVKTKQYKLGLMQDLLTGKVRVSVNDEVLACA